MNQAKDRRERLIILIVTVIAGVANGLAMLVLNYGYTASMIVGSICLLAAVTAVISYRMYCKAKSGKLYIAVTALTVILNLPVAFYTAFWILWVCGLKLIPPPQQ